jgi:hypothetical protein
VATVPSSAIHRWKLDDVGTGTVTDEFNTEDGTVVGASSVSGTWQGGAAADLDGTDDTLDYDNNFNSVGFFPNDEWAFAFTAQPDSVSGSNGIFYAARHNGTTLLSVDHSNNVNGDVGVFFVDDNINFGSFETSSAVLSTSAPKRVVIQKPAGTDVSKAEVFVNGSSVAITVSNNNLGTSYSSYEKTHYGSAISILDGSESNYYNGILDDAIWYNSTLSSSEITADYNIQPWS